MQYTPRMPPSLCRPAHTWCVALGLAALQLACDPFETSFAPEEAAQTYEASRVVRGTPANSLKVMTYNVKFGGGRIDFFFDCHGDRVLMNREEVEGNLDAVAKKIRQVDPDVLFLEEVDVNSKRAAFVDQLQYLLDHTELNYAVYASQWRANFVPSDGLGAVDSGNAIAAKFPLHDGLRIALPLRADLSDVERYFYLHRNLLIARLDPGAWTKDSTAPPLWLMGVHTEAYAKDGTKLAHIERFETEMKRLAKLGLVVGAGDLNTVPPGTTKLKNFDDSACEGAYEADDYSQEQQWLEPLYERYREAIPLATYQADNASFFGHTTRKDKFWNRRLDYIFSNGMLSEGLVHQDKAHGGMTTMTLSDHAPLTAVLQPETP
jgi:endonuclease/exonuclease/phosphatase family metal-dependent hydrolase